MSSVREFLDLTNCTIRFSTYEGEYEGVVRLVSPVNQRLIIEKIFFLPDRVYMGTLHFFFREISDFKVLSRSDTVVPEKSDLRALSRKYESRNLDILDLFDDSDVVSVDTTDLQEFPEEEYVLKLPSNFDNLPLDVVTLDSIGEEFLLAVHHIKSKASIGISLEGPKLGRHGIISWLCVSTSCCTFLFDIQELGIKVFENGLREILEDSSTEKVLHDCREVSDCLFHMFNTRLVNVFDTQVADKLVTMQMSRDGKFNKHVDSLNSCLRNYLAVPEEFLYRNKLSEAYQHRVISFQLRPPPFELQDVMVKNVIYLLPLKKKLEQDLLNPFRRAVEIYLQVLQCASDQELELNPSLPDQIPCELMLEGIQIVRFKDHLEMPSAVASGPPFRKTKNPIELFLEHCKNNKNIDDNANTVPDTNLGNVEKSVLMSNSILSKQSKIHFGQYEMGYSRRELDEKYCNECSKASLEDKKDLINQVTSNEYSSQEDKSDDHWAAFREEFSKLRGAIGDDPEMKKRFIPA